jgi:hypothetical protein
VTADELPPFPQRDPLRDGIGGNRYIQRCAEYTAEVAALTYKIQVEILAELKRITAENGT